MRYQRLLLSLDLQNRIQTPVFLRNKGIDLILAVSDHSQRNRLYTACRKASLHLCPQEGRNLITHDSIQHSSCLLGIHKVHIDFTGMLKRLRHRTLGDFIEGDPRCLLVLKLQRSHQVPGNCFSLAVRVRCQIDLVGLLHALSEIRQKISLSADCDVLRFKIILNIDSHLTSRKITDMSLTCRDIILLSKKLLDGLHLRW